MTPPAWTSARLRTRMERRAPAPARALARRLQPPCGTRYRGSSPAVERVDAVRRRTGRLEPRCGFGTTAGAVAPARNLMNAVGRIPLRKCPLFTLASAQFRFPLSTPCHRGVARLYSPCEPGPAPAQDHPSRHGLF